MDNEEEYKVVVLFDGYSKEIENGCIANCTCTLLKGPKNIIVDTLTAWDGVKLTEALKSHKLDCKDIDYVICTHGHSDHIGCNYLFPKALHIVGHCISHENVYFQHDFQSGKKYVIDSKVKVIPTPGHTLQDVSVVVETKSQGIIVITGDLFENENDLKDDNIWKAAGSDSQELQITSRIKVLNVADWIIPGHGPMFKFSKD